MYNFSIENKCLAAQISKMGGNIVSVRGRDNVEYIWQGNEKYWAGSAPHMFPIAGRLFEDKYSLAGKTYGMAKHGFFRKREMRLAESGTAYLLLRMDSDAETMRQYPFRWEAELEYRLDESTLYISFRVINNSRKKMYFAYGGHPGFCVPIGGPAEFNDYFLQFEPSVSPYSADFSERRLFTGSYSKFTLGCGNRLNLMHSLFDNDAIFLKDSGSNVTLGSDKDTRWISVDYPGMGFLGLWHPPHTDAPFVCIEPWTSLPARDGVVEDLSEKPDMICLGGNDSYQNDWAITFG